MNYELRKLVYILFFVILLMGCQSENKTVEGNREKEQEKEIERLKGLLRNDPTRWEDRHKLGIEYMTAGKNEEAVQEFLGVMSIKPDNIDNLQSLGMVYYKMGKKHMAHFYWRTALEIEPENKFIWDLIRKIVKEKGVGDDSMDIEKWAQHYKNAQKLYKERDYEKAASEFELAAKSNPSDSRTYFSIGAAYKAMDKIDEAISAWQNALKFKPDDLMIMKLISLAKEKKERDTAMVKAQEAVKKDSKDWKAHSRLASLYLHDKHGRFIDEAEAEYKETVRLNPQDPGAYKQLAEINFYKGRYGEGIGYLERASKYLSKDDVIRKRIKDMKLYQKLYQKGQETWNKGGIEKYDEMVFVPDRFFIDKYEVTNVQYKRFLDKNPNLTLPPHWKKGVYEERKDNYPVVNVDWYMAALYCKSMDKRLPTEEEWEKGARGDKGFDYPWGNIFRNEIVNSEEAGFGRLTPVGSFEDGKSPYGIYDMAGNVKEWTDSEYKDGNKQSPFHGEGYKIIRGGSFKSGMEEVKATKRGYAPPVYTDIDVGFRCVKIK
ncbi:MAG: SUMF1/EgtB/PvdO family nonheme iron enzyme [Nitrospinae bacterium]|nr:SUMF1/EgtB/PvdO family nonheme iron enzyme [Nitrospinota bacterium]